MRKRLRKKRHLGEFRQLGFSLRCELRAGLSADDFDRFLDAFLEEAIVRHDLLFNGGGSPEGDWRGVVNRDHRHASTTQAQREAVAAWLGRRAEIVSSTLSPDWDIWYGSDPFA